MIWRFHKMLFFIKRRFRVKPALRQLWSEFEWDEVDEASGRVFMASKARSPSNIRRLMKRRKVNTTQELLLTIEDWEARAYPMQRLKNWIIYLQGGSKYEDTVRPALRELEKRGQVKPKQSVIRRSRIG